MVDLVVDQPCEPTLVDGGYRLALQGGGLDSDPQRPGNEATDVEVAEAALELFIRLVGAVGDAGVQQDDRRGVRVGGWTTAAARPIAI